MYNKTIRSLNWYYSSIQIILSLFDTYDWAILFLIDPVNSGKVVNTSLNIPLDNIGEILKHKSYIQILSFQIFDTSQVEQVLKQCRVSNMIDIKSLHKILNLELANLQNATSNGLGSQRSLIQDEIKMILKYAMEWNAVQDKMVSRKNLLDAWRQVAEMLLCVLPSDQGKPKTS